MSHLQREIERVKNRILTLGTMVEEAYYRAVSAVEKRDASRAREVVDGDHDIDSMEVEIEEECLKILALHQPVAIDLRLLITMLKMNDELERIGDLAVNMAERVPSLSACEVVEVPFDLKAMHQRVQWMLNRSLDSLVNLDDELAREVWLSDRDVDTIYRGMYGTVKERIRETPEHVEALLHYMTVGRCLERIADHATNIAKDVIYMINGEIVRHRSREFMPEVEGECA